MPDKYEPGKSADLVYAVLFVIIVVLCLIYL